MVCTVHVQPLGCVFMQNPKRNVNPPNQISAFDALCEVQSDKASVEITSPFDGVVKDILVKEGEVAKVGEGLCIIEVEDELAEGHAESAPPPPQHAATQSAESLAEKPQAVARDASKPPSATPIQQRRPHPLDPNVPQESRASFGTNAENVLATPSVRHFARQHGVDLAKLAPGSGKNGRIEKSDVEAYLAGAQQPKATQGAPAASQPAAEDVVIDQMVRPEVLFSAWSFPSTEATRTMSSKSGSEKLGASWWAAWGWSIRVDKSTTLSPTVGRGITTSAMHLPAARKARRSRLMDILHSQYGNKAGCKHSECCRCNCGSF